MESTSEKEGSPNPCKVVNKNCKKTAKISRTAVKQMSREELEDCVLQLSAHNVQLKSLLQRSLSQNQSKSEGVEQSQQAKNKKSAKKERFFDFDKHSSRHVLLKFAYLGWDHQGYAVQEDTLNTIEADLFDALLKTKLIKSRQTSNYHRCGRTDKGVSAFSQVISITLRSQLRQSPAAESCPSKELQYVDLLNRVLPDHIRMLAWCPAPENFSARFDCLSRTYKYFFPLGALELQRMRDAGKLLEGHHDFRNFCKMDVGNGVVNFERHIDSVSIKFLKDDFLEEITPVAERNAGNSSMTNSFNSDATGMQRDHAQIPESEGASSSLTSGGDSLLSGHHDVQNGAVPDLRTKCLENTIEELGSSNISVCSEIQCSTSPATPDDSSVHSDTGYEMCVATISGKAFLWHQVRAIMAILLLVGLGKEKPSVVSALLDVKKHPRKPQYTLANEVPLCLFASEFPSEVVQWRYSASAVRRVQGDLQRLWAHHAVRSSMLERMLCEVSRSAGCGSPVLEQHAFLAQTLSKQYQPLLQRKTCESLETRVRHFVKRRRLDAGVLDVVTRGSEERDDDSAAAHNLQTSPTL